MKKLIYIIIIALVACKKSTNEPDIVFTETKNNIELNEPVLLSFGDNSSKENTTWVVEPNADFVIEENGDYATFKFSKNGNYKVVATKSNSKKAVFNVNVASTLYNEYGNSFILESPIYGVVDSPITFKVYNAARDLNPMDWSIKNIPSKPLAYTSNSRTISFQTAGAKYVEVFDGTNKQIKVVFISDTKSNNFTPFIFSDKIFITPSKVNGLINFATKTNYNYNCSSNTLLTDAFVNSGLANSNYVLSLGGFENANNNCAIKGKLNASTGFIKTIPNGTFNFSVNYLNKTFAGTITNNNESYTIDFVNNNYIEFTTKTF